MKEFNGRQIETIVLTKTGKIKTVSIHGNLITVGGKKIQQGIFRDITKEKEIDIKQMEYIKEIETINKELDDFTYIVSHDLKEPLRSIDAFSKFIEKDYSDLLDEDGKNYLHRIRVNSRRMQNLIEDLLEVSRLGRKKNVFEYVDVEFILSEVRSRLETIIEEKQAKLIINQKLPKIYCDRIRITEVFANLLSNALKYNDKQNPVIEISCNEKDSLYEFSVKDNGIGIKKQYYTKIFEIFQRLGRKQDKSGTGAGLTIVKKIIQLHDGNIRVESELGKSTTFIFTIPKKLTIPKEKKT
jgi:light-regulated signal transduction histidine kinase (bacteriophytochrome)